MAGQSTPPILPAITSSPRIDMLLRYGAMAIGGAVVSWGVSWASAHGYKVPSADMIALYAQAAGGVVIVVVATILGLKSVTKSETTVVANTVAAAITGQVPEAIMAKATPEQQAAVVASPVASVTPTPPAQG